MQAGLALWQRADLLQAGVAGGILVPGVFSWWLPPREASGEAARDFSERKQYSTPTLIPPATQASATPTVTIFK